MPAAVSPGNKKAYENQTFTISGLSNATTYNFVLTDDDGVRTVQFTTDGSGNATVTYVPRSSRGTQSYRIDTIGSVGGGLAATTFTHGK